jgi:beta-glucosidase
MDPAHNLNPKAKKGKGKCYSGDLTDGYVTPDQYMEMEGHDRTDIDLPDVQKDLVKKVLALNKPTILFLMNAGAVSLDVDSIVGGAANNHGSSGGTPLAIVEAFYPGKRGGEALAQGIMGKMNSWGRLPYTIYPSNFTKEAEMSMHDLRVAPGRTYRYYRNPLFAFGSGLSLTTFTVSSTTDATGDCSLSTAAPHAVCAVTVTVGNTGKMDGDVVVLAYFRRVRSEEEWRERRERQGVRNLHGRELLTPLKQLFDFGRLAIKSGAQKTITFNVTAAVLAEVDEQSGDLVSEAGEFELVFDSGDAAAGGSVTTNAAVVGNKTVLEKFPSEV